MSDNILHKSSLYRMFHRLFFYIGNTNNRIIETKRRRAIDNGIQTFKVEYEKAVIYGNEDHKTIFNIGLYILIIEYDVSSMKFLIFNEIDDWPKKLVARKLIILLYESSQDLSRMLNKDLRKIINTLPEKSELLKELNEITTNINKFKNAHGKWLYKVRNICSAHRDNVASEQLNSINSIDIHRLQREITVEYMKSIRQINISFMMNLMKAMVEKHKRELDVQLGLTH